MRIGQTKKLGMVLFGLFLLWISTGYLLFLKQEKWMAWILSIEPIIWLWKL
ncbi:hypothetical protein EYB33_12175 [Lysinibacillus sphaericus]|uniref:hypothetical protein n=1 Tax=Lysinibacillus TaxID=400634 RepID=UPI00159EF649|nr:hypothetical protein [Lysinibacillus sphaericus]UDK97017.1 hypothetical protein EYB33_12175 [Lysinibacillus sphaericus]